MLAIAILGPQRVYPKQLLAFGTKGRAPGMFYHPSCISLDGQGNIYVADWGDGRINVFDPTGKFLRLINVGGERLRQQRYTTRLTSSGGKPRS